MEAMALRRPVITTWIAGIPELVHDGVHGWLFPAGSEAELVHAMRRCLEAPVDQLEEMGDRARERVLARHDVERESALLASMFRGEQSTSAKEVVS
jgi:colanic acid/amylovoran biosynthesis glycosyltransferase